MTKRKKLDLGSNVSNMRLPEIYPTTNIRLFDISRIAVRYSLGARDAQRTMPKAIRDDYDILSAPLTLQPYMSTPPEGVTKSYIKTHILGYFHKPGPACGSTYTEYDPQDDNRLAVWFRVPVNIQGIYLGLISVLDGVYHRLDNKFTPIEGHNLGKYLIWPIDNEWRHKIVLADSRDVI